MADPVAKAVAVVGLIGGRGFGPEAREAVERAEVVVGSRRQLALVEETHCVPSGAERLVLSGALDAVLDTVEDRRSRGAGVCVLASGDPGFFGIVRALGERFGSEGLAVHPAPSSVALAFSRLGCSWDDAVVVSAHGRPLGDAIARIVMAPKSAVLTSPENPPEAVAAALAGRGQGRRPAAVVTRIGETDEAVVRADLGTIATSTFDPMSILVALPVDGRPAAMGLAWGLDEARFDHRDGMITKAEVRAVVLGKLALPSTGVLWDVGAGSGSVAIEAARLCPGLTVLAVETDPESVERITTNASAHGATIAVVAGEAPDALVELPDPDRVFVGGGGIDVLDAALARLRPGGVVVANYALLDRAVTGWRRLGNLAEISIARAARVGDDGVRLTAQNPVFVCWGPS